MLLFKKNFCILFFIVFLYFIIQHFHLTQYLSMSGFNKYHGILLNYYQIHKLKFILYFIFIYIISISLFIPGTIFLDIFSGYIFGYFYGSSLVIICYTLGAFFNFLIVKNYFNAFFANKVLKFKDMIKSKKKKYILLNLISLRMVAIIPFWAINILAALLNIDLTTFIFSTFIGVAPISIVYVMIGVGIKNIIVSKSLLTLNVLYNNKAIIALILIALLIFIPNYLWNRKTMLKK